MENGIINAGDFVDSEKTLIINNEYDYSNIVPVVEGVIYLVEYCDSVFRQIASLIEEDEARNEKIKYEYRKYNYKKNFSNYFEINIYSKNFSSIVCKDSSSFKSAVENGNLNNIGSLTIKLNLGYKRGIQGNFIEHENSFVISFKPYDIKFIRKSNHKEFDMDKIEKDIINILNRFNVVNNIFCTK